MRNPVRYFFRSSYTLALGADLNMTTRPWPTALAENELNRTLSGLRRYSHLSIWDWRRTN